MNRHLTFSFPISMTLNTQAILLRAANKPRAEMEKTIFQWTNKETERLRALGLISIVGQPATAEAATAATPPEESGK